MASQERSYYNKAITYYQNAFETLKDRSGGPPVWDICFFEISTTYFSFATLLQDYPVGDKVSLLGSLTALSQLGCKFLLKLDILKLSYILSLRVTPIIPRLIMNLITNNTSSMYYMKLFIPYFFQKQSLITALLKKKFPCIGILNFNSYLPQRFIKKDTNFQIFWCQFSKIHFLCYC